MVTETQQQQTLETAEKKPPVVMLSGGLFSKGNAAMIGKTESSNNVATARE